MFLYFSSLEILPETLISNKIQQVVYIMTFKSVTPTVQLIH